MNINSPENEMYIRSVEDDRVLSCVVPTRGYPFNSVDYLCTVQAGAASSSGLVFISFC